MLSNLSHEAAAATASRHATEAALEILAAGGNAVDAAVGAAWALAVCEPSGSGLGGQTTLMIYFAEGAVRVVDGHSYAPAAASLAEISSQQQRTGYRACAIPSTPATLGYTHRTYGLLNASRVMAPAIRLAREGYAISRLQYRQTTWVARHLQSSRGARELFLRNGHPPAPGTNFQQPELAATLIRLAECGTDDFYRGAIARLIVKDMQEQGGLITERDLADCTLPVDREPLAINYRGYRILSVPPPGGGLRLLLALKLLEYIAPDGFDARDCRWYEMLALATYAAFYARERCLFRSADFAAFTLRMLQAQGTQIEAAMCAGSGCAEGPGETTHLTVTDRRGNVVALTQSIQSLFGAKVANRELGFLYNNYLCTCPRRAGPYQLGKHCQPRSNAAPALVMDGGRPVLALGAAGSRRIISANLHVISSVIDCGSDVVEAVDAPRVHALLSGKVWIEKPAVSEALLEMLRPRFQRVEIRKPHDFAMGAVQALQLRDDGSVLGAADPRREGVALCAGTGSCWHSC